MIVTGLKAGSFGAKFLKKLYQGKRAMGKASKSAASFAAKKNYAKTSQFITGASKKTHKGFMNVKKAAYKYPKSAAAVSGALAWDIVDRND
jgi:hypothetical protein